ncbi:MAG: hypothetical protein Q4A16_07655 [Lautropia sp.]|nr:hypothetical protein [Lautropia sp.]
MTINAHAGFLDHRAQNDIEAPRPPRAALTTAGVPDGLGTPPQTPTHAAQPRLVLPTKDGLGLDSPEFARLYGPGIFNQNALANTIIGTYRNRDSIVSNRFLSTVSGHLASMRLYWQTGLGYASGNGGLIKLSIFPDDGTSRHLPDMTAKPLATAFYRPGLIPGAPKQSLFPEIQVRHSDAELQKGRLYHLVIENIDPRSNENFISSNNAVTNGGNGRPSRWLNTRDWSTLMGVRPRGSTRPHTWSNLTEQGSSGNYFSPILQLVLRNGQTQGVSDMEGGSVDPKLVYTATQYRPVRERFTPSSDKRISGLSVATAASIGGTMSWRIMQDKQELASGQIRQPRPNYRPLKMNTGLLVAKMHWYDIELPADKELLLKARQSYDVEFTPNGNSEWKFAVHRNGAAYDFSWPAAFTESQAQHWLNGRWLDTYHWDYSRSEKGANWPVVLHLAP